MSPPEKLSTDGPKSSARMLLARTLAGTAVVGSIAYWLSEYVPSQTAGTSVYRNHPSVVRGLLFLGHALSLCIFATLVSSWRQLKLPREGFTADAFQLIIKATIFNAATYYPVYWFLGLTPWGQSLVRAHPRLISPILTIVVALALLRDANSWLNRKALNNFTTDRYDWDKEFVVVTGGSDGIGKHIVLMLAARGIKVAVLDIQAPTYPLPPTATYLHTDLTSLPSLQQSCAALQTHPSPPTILILNAGLANFTPLLAIAPPALQRIFALNTLSHFHLCQALLPAMIAADHGTVVTMASLAAYVPCAGLVDYAATKAAAMAFHEALGAELVHVYRAPRIRTVLVAPSWARSQLTRGLRRKAGLAAWLSPLLEAESVAEAVVETVLRGQSGTVHLPRIHEWFGATLRAWPWWLQGGVRRGAVEGLGILRARGVDLSGRVKGMKD